MDEPKGGLDTIKILEGLGESNYFPCMIEHHFAWDFVYIFHTSLPPKALFLVAISCNPTPPDALSWAIPSKETRGSFFLSEKFPFHIKSLIIFWICKIIEEGALRIDK